MGFIQIDGRSLLHNGKKIHLHGVNLGNWMLIEHFMIGLPWVEHKMREQFLNLLGSEKTDAFFGTYMEEFISDDDFRFLSSMGCNVVRVPFNYRHFENDSRPGVICEDGFVHLDRVLDLCRKHNIFALLDLHAAAGAQARDWNAESEFGEAMFWKARDFQERTALLWKAIASRYRNDPIVFGYEILNEPVAPDMTIFHQVNLQLIKAIREIDKEHVIVIESNNWGKEIASLSDDLFEDTQVMPSLHHYHSQFPPFDRLQHYPGEFDGKQYGAKELIATMKGTYDEERIKRPMLVGEFGIHRRFGAPEAQNAMLDDELAFFNEKGFHWTIWSYKDIGEMGFVYPSESTPWKNFLKSSYVYRYREGIEHHLANFIGLLHKEYPEMEDSALAHFQRETRRNWHELSLEMIIKEIGKYGIEEIRSFARSFAFRYCDVDKKRYEIIKKQCEK